jgi:hypothetical protein
MHNHIMPPMRNLLRLLEQSYHTSPVDWHAASSSILFSAQDLDLFIQNWGLPSAPGLDLKVQAVLEHMRHLFSDGPIKWMQHVKPFMRMANSKHHLGLKLQDAQLLDPVKSKLKLVSFDLDDQMHAPMLSPCGWDKAQRMITTM